MTGQEHLERGSRRLLAWYPRAFRQEHGPEILAVLMASAPHGQRRPGLAESADLMFGPTLPALTWLAGLAAVWQLWRPASTAFFRPPGSTQALHQAQMAELARLRSSRARLPRQV